MNSKPFFNRSLNRRRLLQGAAALPALSLAAQAASGERLSLKAPAKGKIPVAIVLGEGATMIDFAGPWEVFQDVMIEGRGTAMEEMHPFQLFTVSDSTEMLRSSFGMKIVPDYTFENAPQPKIVVMGAQGGHTDAKVAWIKKVYPEADLVMSVCTGAFLLAKTGLLDGKSATTHHDFYDGFAKKFPNVKLQRNLRYSIASSKLASAGGLTSGVDLALHVVDSYFGREVTERTVKYMEYQSKSWMG